ncbi:hypothetical protein TNCV_4558911 [Trichonephila clavipes]|nr:hypothetical protein TNCV_4558911 [Trichonephila clavipes]
MVASSWLALLHSNRWLESCVMALQNPGAEEAMHDNPIQVHSPLVGVVWKPISGVVPSQASSSSFDYGFKLQSFVKSHPTAFMCDARGAHKGLLDPDPPSPLFFSVDYILVSGVTYTPASRGGPGFLVAQSPTAAESTYTL